MYNHTEWKDHVTQYPNRRIITDNGDGTSNVVKDQGEVIQQGTAQSATNFGNMEDGILDAYLGAKTLLVGNLQQQRQNDAHMEEIDASFDAEVTGETKTVTLTNSAAYPFNSTMDNPTTVALTTTRKNLFYTVEAEVTAHTGEVGDIHITDKALNGFKVSFDGSASSVTLTLRIKGGMT